MCSPDACPGSRAAAFNAADDMSDEPRYLILTLLMIGPGLVQLVVKVVRGGVAP